MSSFRNLSRAYFMKVFIGLRPDSFYTTLLNMLENISVLFVVVFSLEIL
jgi:hypothetical protein